jgi:hypothetical protein
LTGIFTPRMEILPTVQRRLWPHLKPVSQLGFVLYGGTAIALRLGHRASVDFDFFTERSLDKKALYVALPCLKTATVLQERPDSLMVLLALKDEPNPVKLSFFGEIDFGRVGEPQQTEDGTLWVASLLDLFATKLKVILQRVEAKDYRDIAAMIQAGVGLEQGLASARALFGSAFQPSESLKALVYFQGGDLEALSILEKEILVEAVKEIKILATIEKISDKLCV